MSKEFNPYEFPTPESVSQSRIESEVVHIPTDDATEQLSEEELLKQQEEEREEREEEERQRARQEAREKNVFWQFISGNFLILESIKGTYRYLIIVAVALFFSVVSIFYSFHLGEKYTKRESQVQLLHERKLDYQRTRFDKTSHTAIVKELKRRGIPLYDIQESRTIIEK